MSANSKPPSGKLRLPGFEDRFRRENLELIVQRARFLLWTVVVLYPAFYFLDLVVAPGLALPFLGIRLAVLALYAVGLVAVYSRRARSLAEMVVMVCAVASAAGISVMAAMLGGFTSNYFVGIVIVIFVIGFFMPWSLRMAVTLCTLIVVSYAGINTTVHGWSREMIPPLFFLAGTSVFTYLATLSSLRTQRRDLSLRLRLEMANEELKELGEARNRFFANISHELRTPLTLIFGPLETLLGSEDDSGRTALLESMAVNSRRLLRQVDALLDMAKLESGRLRLEPAVGDLGSLLQDLVDATAPHAARRGIDLSTRGFERLPRFAFDRHKVEMIAANLLTNAVKFTPQGGSVTLRANADSQWVEFEVEDTGPGIPAEELERIFDRFHQVEDPSSRRKQGTGLGLALARELARLHGGDVTASSSPGTGASLRVKLPRRVASLPDERRSQQRRMEDRLVQSRREDRAAQEFSRRTTHETLLADVGSPPLSSRVHSPGKAPADAPSILLVDDNEELRTYMANGLSWRYRIETAADGEEGLAAARELRPDLVVADVMMPRMDGFELCRRLKDDPAFSTMPVILVTARATTEAVVEGLSGGADDYVTKPFVLRELEARIASQLRARETERQLHERESRLAAIGQMTSSVVHDLRNPLSVVQGYVDLARSQTLGYGDPESIANDLEHAHEATERLRRMVQEVLEFARSGSTRLKPKLVIARDFLSRVAEELRPDFEERGVALAVDLRLAEGQRVRIDPEGIRRVLENLLINARDAVSGVDGPRAVRFEARVADADLVVRVADSGPGIAPGIVDHLFEPFTSEGKKHGIGLGLVTVRNLVKAHGGEVAAEAKSAEGGAAFTVRLPLPATGEEEERSESRGA